MKSQKYHTVGTVPNFNRKIVERGKFDSLNTYVMTRQILTLCSSKQCYDKTDINIVLIQTML